MRTITNIDRGVAVEHSPIQDSDSALRLLMRVIEARKRDLPTGSYTTTLFQGGHAKISAKVAEESQELLEATATLQAAVDADTRSTTAHGALRQHCVHEAADLFYHVLVLLGHHGIGFHEVEAELRRRFGSGGLQEKAARLPKD